MLVCTAFQEDRRVSSSDAGGGSALYEQRFSTSSQSPPSFSRLPPDGHEFPSSYSEGLSYAALDDSLTSQNSPATLPRSPSKSSSERRATGLRWRRQDERSERSVRDKIAMFSAEKACLKAKNRKIDRSESVSAPGHTEKTCMKRSLTEDDVRIESEGKDVNLSKDGEGKQNVRKQGKPTIYSSMINVRSDSDAKENVKPASSVIDIRDKSPKRSIDIIQSSKSTLKSKINDSKDGSITGLNNRSQSLIDIGKPSRMKRHSVGAYDRPSVYKYGVEKPEDRERRTSLNNMIEQRRKSMSKLRGLVIPETRSKNEIENRLPLDLPRISSHTSQNYKTMSLPRDDSKHIGLYKTDSISSIDSCSSNTSSRHSTTPVSYSSKAIVKLSPAHNRKHSFGTKNDSLPPLCSRSSRHQSPLSDISSSSSTITAMSPQRSFDRSVTPNSELSFELDGKYSYSRSHPPVSSKPSLESRFSRNEDSDNESAVSSSQSSFSQSLSPRTSPMPDYDQEDRDSPSGTMSRSRHSPQSSSDEVDAKRVLKNGSVEAKNRRNILNSAKCSSGRSSDEQSTPEVVRKFSKDSPSEPYSFTDRLDSELKDVPPKTSLRRQESLDSSSSLSSHLSSDNNISRKSSKDSVIHSNKKYSDSKTVAQPVYFDGEGDMFKESQVKVAYLNEIVDDYENLLEADKGTVINEFAYQTKKWSDDSTPKNTIQTTTHVDNKWNALEQKYSTTKVDNERIETKVSKYISSEPVVSQRFSYAVSTKKSNFRALSDKWKQRTEEDSASQRPQSLSRSESLSKSDTQKENAEITRKSSREHSNSISDGNESQTYENREDRPTTLDLPRIDLPDRKFSVPEYSSALKLREKRELSSNDIPSRPTSLIENGAETLQPNGVVDGSNNNQYMTVAHLSPSASTSSREDLADSSGSSSLSRTGSKEVLDAFSRAVRVGGTTVTTPKIAEFVRAFERHGMSVVKCSMDGSHPRMSSMDSTASDDAGAQYGSASSLASGQRDQYGSITSLCSSTSIISSQELAQLIEDANHSLEESGTPSHEILVVVLHREIIAHGSIGITLAGGADYETKEITVHKVIPGSLADRDGRVQKGDRVLSINGKNLKGVSHREALNILKSPRPEVVLVVSRSRSVTPQDASITSSLAAGGDGDGGSLCHRPVFINHVQSRPPKILESPMDSKSLVSDLPAVTVPRGPPMSISLVKDGAGLGFSLQGGKDSPLGDRPLTVKKIFSGGAADKGGVLKVGDELFGVNSVDVTNMARIVAWNFLKKLPDGTVNLIIRQKLKDETKENKN